LSIVEHMLRPQEILRTDVFERPERLAPDITRLSDRAMLLTRYAARGFDEGDAAPFDLQQLLDSMTAGDGMANEVSPGAGDSITLEPESDSGSAGVAADTVGTAVDVPGTVADTAGAVTDTAVALAGGGLPGPNPSSRPGVT
jgi:hypothetical protein